MLKGERDGYRFWILDPNGYILVRSVLVRDQWINTPSQYLTVSVYLCIYKYINNYSLSLIYFFLIVR